MKNNFQEKVSFIWSVADLLRGDYKPSEYQDVILPLTVLRRLDAVLEPTKDKVLKRHLEVKKRLDRYDLLLKSVSGYPFYNTSKFTFKTLMQDPDNITVANHEMGTIFEELIRKFAEQSNETAGEHFTPREVIQLMVKLIIAGNGGLKTPNIIKAVYDPACGTGGMLTIAKNEITKNINPSAKVYLYGQELNPKTYAIAKSDMLIKGENANNLKKGNSFSEDQLEDEKFDFMISNPPYGVDWKKVARQIRAEHKNLGFDGSLLFLQHMISKMKPVSDGGSRIAIIFNGSPLFTGDAGSGESEIRKWIIENDWLEAIVGLPDNLFYNTGIHTYIWLVTNNKAKKRQGKIQLIDAREMFKPMRKSLGSKRHYLSDKQIEKIVKIYKKFENKGKSKIFDNNFFGFRKIAIERPRKDDKGKIEVDKKGNPKPDTSLRDYERVSLAQDIHEYFEKEVKPYVSDAWIDEKKTKIGYEINFTRYFYKYKSMRPLKEISGEIKQLKKDIARILTDLEL